jgi:hypothetical protein
MGVGRHLDTGSKRLTNATLNNCSRRVCLVTLTSVDFVRTMTLTF